MKRLEFDKDWADIIAMLRVFFGDHTPEFDKFAFQVNFPVPRPREGLWFSFSLENDGSFTISMDTPQHGSLKSPATANLLAGEIIFFDKKLKERLYLVKHAPEFIVATKVTRAGWWEVRDFSPETFNAEIEGLIQKEV
jgi:hypothetical protein